MYILYIYIYIHIYIYIYIYIYNHVEIQYVISIFIYFIINDIYKLIQFSSMEEGDAHNQIQWCLILFSFSFSFGSN